MKRQPRNTWIIGIVTAVGVLVAAAAGTALARAGTSTSASPITAAQAKRIAKSVADAEIARLAPRLSVKTARTAGRATFADAPRCTPG